MTKILLISMMLVSTAFAGEMISFKADFSLNSCWVEEDGFETCESTVTIPAPEQPSVLNIELKTISPELKRGEAELVQTTEAGEFRVLIEINKTNKTYTMMTHFIDPDWYSVRNEDITFTRPSEIGRNSFEGSMWSLGDQKYLVPAFSIWR